jgi:hypothetical protein
MATDHRKVSEQLTQEILLEDPNFLREIVERVLQEMLEAEMTEHIGAAPYERSATRTGHRNGYKPRTLRTRVGTLNLLVPQDLKKATSVRAFSRATRGTRGRSVWRSWRWVGGGGLDQEGQGSDRRAVRDLLLQEPRFFPGRLPRLGARGLEGSPTRSAGLPLRVRGRPLREGQGVINPELDYSPFLGGTDTDIGNAIAVDATGSAYVTGFIPSPYR